MNSDVEHEIDWIKHSSSFEFWFEILCANAENDIYLTTYNNVEAYFLGSNKRFLKIHSRFRIKQKVPKSTISKNRIKQKVRSLKILYVRVYHHYGYKTVCCRIVELGVVDNFSLPEAGMIFNMSWLVLYHII